MTAVVPRTKSGYMLENPSISEYRRFGTGDKLWSADNQQERLVPRLDEPESSETIRQTSLVTPNRDDEMVRSVWRHAEHGRNVRAPAFDRGGCNNK